MSIRQGNNTIAGGPWDFEKQITNCITEIPQDIKLELDNGTLTLKAGSKVYVPNGSGTFDELNITSDVTAGTPYTDGLIFVYYYNDSNIISQANSSAQCSGASNTIINGFWYDTTNNIIKRITNSEVTYSGISFPIAIINASNGSWTSIDQVFNGFGYIGSTIFALPGVKGLIPNGRNADGSLKNDTLELQNVKIYTETSYTGNAKIVFTSNGSFDIASYTTWNYDESSNLFKYTPNGKLYSRLILTGLSLSSGKITTFEIPTAFHALDYNDSSTISGWSMPSSHYINLTPGVSGASYTAPANGLFNCHVRLASSGQGVALQNTTTGVITRVHASSSNQLVATTISARKGDTIIYQYGTEATTSPANTLHFYYSEGEN